MKVSNVFNNLTLKKKSWKTKTFFKKLEYGFLVETIKIENTLFPFKTALSEANVKTNRMATIKWTYHKEWGFASNYFIFFRQLSPVLEPFKKSYFDVPMTQMCIFVIFVSTGVYFYGAFSL